MKKNYITVCKHTNFLLTVKRDAFLNGFFYGETKEAIMSRKSRKNREFKRRVRKFYNQGDTLSMQNYNHIALSTSNVVVVPKTITQDKLVADIQDTAKDIVLAIGPAGTGKTYLATKSAIKAFVSKEVGKIVITRPAVSVDEQHGFLPGNLVEKMAPWTRPIFDVFEEHFNLKEIEYMLEMGKIEVAPLAYMRGRTFKNTFIIADEMQNATPSQFKMLMTRIGQDSKMIVTGDLDQHDRGFEQNGLKDFCQRLRGSQSSKISLVEFDARDIKRHPVIEDVLNLYHTRVVE